MNTYWLLDFDRGSECILIIEVQSSTYVLSQESKYKHVKLY